MSDVRYLNILPAEDPVRRSKGLNLLLMVDNPGEETAATVRFYGTDGTLWRELFAKEQVFQGHSHIHAYFHLPPSCFSAETWGGEAPEELELWAGENPPGPAARGTFLFLEP